MSDSQYGLESALATAGSAWSAIASIALGVASFVASEFLPVSLLTPLAHGLGISPGMAGQSVAIVGLAAIAGSLFVTTVTRGIDRRRVVLVFSALLALSNLIAALAPTLAVLMIGRVLLGFGLGGLWAMAAALTMRLARPADIPQAFAIVFGGVSVAMVVAAPVGSLIETVIGWRGVFLIFATIGLACLAWQALVLPAMPAEGGGHVKAVFSVLRLRGAPVAMLAIGAVFAGQIAIFTYIRPLLETHARFDVAGISTMLLIFGVANFVGTSMSSAILRTGLRWTLAVAPLVIAFCAASMLAIGAADHYVSMGFITLWGTAFGCVPIAWSTWVTRNFGDNAENAGSLQVAAIQLANTFGAAVGGLTFDAVGMAGPMFLGICLLLATFALVAICMKECDY
ncbi:MFS transporter [Ralstonia pseudosolanacearum]|uniref:MFS transporter n=1 Tax=Ralstonia solanacearum TaxID=305 RepID=A0AAD0SER0_RALSL|nr:MULTISPECIES: MFS transporter [Ralstonia solanacearum species complex]AXV82267.1 MFS transporter [Ralstonia solanacearum]AXW53394.1 MFS transporter [Ralstonia solanacearum]MDC6292761.1 MFS transporter [Ralstonia pseudosolanacearum]MDD7787915.1 MFS transporter [Ralstonia pseudosolanacearum]MDN3369857.1 MFS transporter [Ralstonia pseudosolanacearum]